MTRDKKYCNGFELTLHEPPQRLFFSRAKATFRLQEKYWGLMNLRIWWMPRWMAG